MQLGQEKYQLVLIPSLYILVLFLPEIQVHFLKSLLKLSPVPPFGLPIRFILERLDLKVGKEEVQYLSDDEPILEIPLQIS